MYSIGFHMKTSTSTNDAVPETSDLPGGANAYLLTLMVVSKKSHSHTPTQTHNCHHAYLCKVLKCICFNLAIFDYN